MILKRPVSVTLRLLAAAILALASLLTLVPQAHAESGECDANAVIRCGTYSIATLKQKYTENAGNTQGAYKYLIGVTSPSQFDGMTEGILKKDHKVYINGKVIATDAVTLGRIKATSYDQAVMNGQFYQRPAGSFFASGVDSIQLFVKMDGNNQFMYAVEKTCGNPLKATPIPQPKPQPKPQPQPVPNFTVEKDVRTMDSDAWSQEVTVKPGDHVVYRFQIHNTGQTDFDQVVFKEEMPQGITQVIGKATFNGNGITNDLRDAMHFGPLKQGDTTVITYEAAVGTSVDACTTGLVNTASAQPTGLPEKSDTAVVKVCAPAKPAVATPVPPAQPKPTVLVETGPGSIVAIVAAVSILGVALYRLKSFYLSRLS